MMIRTGFAGQDCSAPCACATPYGSKRALGKMRDTSHFAIVIRTTFDQKKMENVDF
jgi:hypothetical protein